MSVGQQCKPECSTGVLYTYWNLAGKKHVKRTDKNKQKQIGGGERDGWRGRRNVVA